MGNEANCVEAYRLARRDFIAAVTQAGGDAISRVHPAKGPDGKPLFCDSAAWGPRDAARGLLLVAGQDGALTEFLRQRPIVPKGARMVAVHALDPFSWAWGRTGAPSGWPQNTLADIALEDLSRVSALTMLALDDSVPPPLPRARVIFRSIKPGHGEQALRAAIAAL